MKSHSGKYEYFDVPARESDNSVDRFFLRAKEHTFSERSKFYFLN